MEKQTLPNSTLILVFGILSIVGCCCYGVGIIFAVIAIVMAKKATAMYTENPELYEGFNNVKTGKILSIIGIVLGVIYLGYVIFIFATVGVEGYQQIIEEMAKGYQSAQ